MKKITMLLFFLVIGFISGKAQSFKAGDGSSGNPYQVATATHLNNIRNFPTRNFVITDNIDLTTFGNWNPITNFSGNLDGKGFTIKGLKIDEPTSLNVGFIGENEGIIKNISLDVVQIIGGNNVGALVGNNMREILNCDSKGSVECLYAGGSGGLVGENNGSINTCNSQCIVKGPEKTGGLIGYNMGDIKNSYANGTVSGVGSYDVYVGGLVGFHEAGAIIDKCYASASIVAGGTYRGAFAGGVGNMWGVFWGEITASYFDKALNGTLEAIGETDIDFTAEELSGKNPEEMREIIVFTGWDFNNTWKIWEGCTYPVLKWQSITPNCTNFAGGNGSAGNPYQITKAIHLDNLRNFLGRTGVYFKVSQDIDLTHFIVMHYPTEGWMPIGEEGVYGTARYFRGNLNGGCNSIKGMWINRKDKDYVGLFGVIGTGGIVSNLGIELIANQKVEGANRTGILCGLHSGSIEKCFTTGEVKGKQYVGGVVGECKKGSILKSYNSAKVSGERYVGGFTGSINLGRVEECYNSARVSKTPTFPVSGFTDTIIGTTNLINNCYYDSYLNTQRVVNPGIKFIYYESRFKEQANFVGFDFAGTWVMAEGYTNPLLQCHNCTRSLSIAGQQNIIMANEDVFNYTTDNTMQTYRWSITGGTILSGYNTGTVRVRWGSEGAQTIKLFAEDANGCFTNQLAVINVDVKVFEIGDGSHSNPFQIRNARELDFVRKYDGAKGAGKYFKIMNDIDLNNYILSVYGNSGWDPIPHFHGTLFSNNNRVNIKGLTINRTLDKVGMISELSGEIKGINLILPQNGVVKGEIVTGTLVGINYGRLSNCSVVGNNSMLIGKIEAGGLVARNHGYISHCFAEGSMIIYAQFSAGLIANNYNVVTSSGVDLAINGHSLIGGLVNGNFGVITWCYANVDINNIGDATGGLVEYNPGTVANSYCVGTLNGRDRTAGLIAYNTGAVFSSYANCNISGTTNSGGLIGKIGSGSKIAGCYSASIVNSSSTNGAFIGSRENLFPFNQGSVYVDNCYYDKVVSTLPSITNVGNNDYINIIGEDVYKMSLKTTYGTQNLPFGPEVSFGIDLNEFIIWNFNDIWMISNDGGYHYPTLGISSNPLGLDYRFYDNQFQYPVIRSAAYPELNMASATTSGIMKTGVLSEKSASVQVYPNPTQGVVKVETNGQILSDIEVYSATGKLLFKTDKLEFDLSAYSKGIYIVRVNGEAFKVILNK